MTDSETDSDLGRSIRESIDARLDAARIMPDPDDVFRRAAELQEARVDAFDDREALRPFVIAYRDWLDAQVDALDAGRPPAPLRRTSIVPWVIAMAAALLLVVGALSWMGELRLTMLESPETSGNEAQHGSNAERPVAEARARDAESERRRRPRGAGPAVGPTEPEPAEVEPEPAEVEPEPAEVEPEPTEVEPEPKQSLSERLSALDASAQAAWRRGELRKAERTYRTIVRLGGRREVAELAYGELFAIVRQRGGDLKSLWRAYLRRFPRGRYAEDVTAGLCRRASAQERDECWARYRARFPNGIHAP